MGYFIICIILVIIYIVWQRIMNQLAEKSKDLQPWWNNIVDWILKKRRH